MKRERATERKGEQVLDYWQEREAAEERNLRPPVLACPHTNRLQIRLCGFFEHAAVKVHWQVSWWTRRTEHGK